jgi:hypothetical protein
MDKLRMIESLGAKNKKYLRDRFGYANIRAAYSVYNVNNANDAYEALKFENNNIVEQARKDAAIAKAAKKLEDNKIYITTVQVKFDIKDKNGKKRSFTKNISFTSKKKDIKKKKEEEIGKYEGRYIQESLFTKVSATPVGSSSVAVGLSQGLENIKMKNAVSYGLSGEEEQIWDTKEGKCVFDYLIHLYGDVKGFKKMMNYEFLQNQFGENSLEEGVSTKQIELFCKQFGLSYYALDSNEKTLSFYVAKDKKTTAPALIFRILNGHMYPIENVKRRTGIVRSNRDCNIKTKSVEQIKGAEKEIVIKELIAPTDEDEELTGNDFAIDYINKCGKIPYPLKSNNLYFEDGHITRMVIDDKIINTQPIDEDIKNYFEKNERTYQGENLNNILMELWEDTYNEKMYEGELMSEYNNEVYDMLSRDGVKHRVHYGATREIKNEEINEKLVGCDIEKCYSSLLLNPMDDFIIMDLTDEVEYFTDDYYYYDDSCLPFGLYYVNTNDLTILHQSNIYSNKILDYAKQNGIEFKIQYQIKSANSIDKDYFKTIIKTITEKATSVGLIKKLINSITGCLGKTQSKHLKVGLTNNIDEVWENEIIRDIDNGKEIYFNKLSTFKKTGGKEEATAKTARAEALGSAIASELIVFGEIIKTEMIANALPIYIQILDWSNIILDKMIKEMGGECVFRKTDCAVVIGGNPVIEMEKDKDNIMKTWGSFRNETFENIKDFNYEKKMKSNRHIEPIYLNQNWNILPHSSSNQYKEIIDDAIKYGGLRIDGRAGTGKSYIILEGIRQGLIPDEPNCRLAFTNKAAQNLNGTTIHKALAINANEKSNSKSLEGFKNKKIIVVDEIGMINKQLWKHLCILKKKNPHLIFILLGDYRQTKPIEDFEYDYFNSSIVRYLTNGNKIELTEKQRYDDELWNFLENYYEKDIIGKLKHSNKIDMNKKMICYYNATRDEVNNFCMNKCKTNNSLYLPYERLDKNDKANSAYIYEGLPIMSIKNNCKLNIINTDEFKVKEFSNETITLQRLDNDDEDDLIIEINDFHKNFVVNYISTTHKLQGATITEDLLIFDWYGREGFSHSLRGNKNVGYTALSRVKSLNQIYIHF